MYDMEHNEELEPMIQEADENKEFMPNPKRADEISLAFDLMSELFPLDSYEIEDDPTQFGNFLIHIELPRLVLMEKNQIRYYNCMMGIFDNIEISKTSKGIAIDAVIEDAFFRRDSTKITDTETDEI